MVPRKGLSGNVRNTSIINDLTPPPLHRLYQGNVPLSSSTALSDAKLGGSEPSRESRVNGQHPDQVYLLPTRYRQRQVSRRSALDRAQQSLLVVQQQAIGILNATMWQVDCPQKHRFWVNLPTLSCPYRRTSCSAEGKSFCRARAG